MTTHDETNKAWDSYCTELVHWLHAEHAAGRGPGFGDVASRDGFACGRGTCTNPVRSGLPIEVLKDPTRAICASCVLTTNAHRRLRQANADVVTQTDMDFWRGKAPTLPQVRREDDDPRLR